MSLFSTFLLFRKGSGVNSFLLVFRKWMQNKRSIPRKRTTLTFPATPRSARILDKRQWYVFVFYFSSLQKSWRVKPFLLVFREWMQNKRNTPRKRRMLAYSATPRSARTLVKKQWYVFVFYFCTIQRR